MPDDDLLTFKRQAWVARAFAVLWAVRVGLWFLPYGTVRRLIQRYHARCAPSPVSADARPSEIVWSVNAAARLTPGSTCFVRALAARLLLARAGIPSLVYVGVRRTPAGIGAHAWLECRGETCMGARGSESYTALSRDCI